MPFTSSGEVWIFCTVPIHPCRVPSPGEAPSFPFTQDPSTEGSSHSHPRATRHNKGIMDVSGAWSFLQEDKFRQALGGDDDFRSLLLRNSFSVNWRFPDLAAKGTVLIFTSELQRRGSTYCAHINPQLFGRLLRILSCQLLSPWYRETEIKG